MLPRELLLLGIAFSSPCGPSFQMSFWIKATAVGFIPNKGGFAWTLGKTLVMGLVKYWNTVPGNGAATASLELGRMHWDGHPSARSNLEEQRALTPLPGWILGYFNACCDKPVGMSFIGMGYPVLYQDLISRNVLNP